MDSSPTPTVVSASAMRTAGSGCGQLLLPREAGVGGESLLPAIARRGIYPSSLLRRAQDDALAALAAPCSGSQTSASSVAGDGFDGRLSQAAFEPQSSSPQAFSVSAQGRSDRATQPGLEHRHHLYSAAGWVCLSGRGHGLVQPLRAGLGVIAQFGSRLLCGGAGAGVESPAAGDLQHRPGGAIYQSAVSGTVT